MWKLTDKKRMSETPRMEIVRKTYTDDNGEDFSHIVIQSKPSVAIIIRRQNRICFIKQFRFTTGKCYLEVPAGLIEEHETEEEAAIREAREETGYLITDVKTLVKGPSLLDISKSNENFGVVIATASRKKSRCLDKDEHIEEQLIWLDQEEVFKRLLKQMTNNEPFFEDLYLSGHTVYALLSYKFLK